MDMRLQLGCALVGALALSGCALFKHEPDPTLQTLTARPTIECPADQRRTPVGGGLEERVGVMEYELARTPLSGDRGTLRTRRLDVAPGGSIAWHEHSTRQGAALIVSGEINEYRSDCSVALRYRVGDIAREDQATAHYWRNESGETAVILVTDVLP